MKLKKAAMFGLDARIALAIFGALSVISGAALYSAIQSAKVTNQHTTLQEIVKALEAYMVDTGSVDVSYALDDIVVNRLNKPGWNGPYLSDYDSPLTQGIRPLQETSYNTAFYSIIYVFIKSDEDWPADQSGWGATCGTGDTCAQWLRLSAANNDKDRADMDVFFNAIDKAYDNGDGPVKGQYRLLKPSGVGAGAYYFYVKATVAPNN
tara:strand:- start:1782 stop:2405 length:624 start_codon:yes stop_codon:yes gene_type:complete